MALEKNIIETYNSDGEVMKYNLFDVVTYEGQQYAMLLDPEDDIMDEEAEIIIMRLKKDEEGKHQLEDIEDEEELTKVAEYIDSLILEEE